MKDNKLLQHSMLKPIFGLLMLCAGLLALPSIALSMPAAQQDSRVALVIGNSNYSMSPLVNPVNDARAMSEVLRKLGFDVVTLLDASYPDMVKEVRRFGDRSRGGGGVALFYFAGHGIQMGGINYLIPVGADIRKEHEVKYNTLNMNQVLDEMELSNNRVNIVVLDACRNNPFARSFRSISKGLAHIDAPSGTLITFATAPGSVASDGTGSNGLYTEEILKYIQEPGVPVEQMFKWVRGGVIKHTSGEQVPWESSSLVGDFYFNPAPELAMPLSTPQPAQQSPISVDPKQVELTYWESIKNSNSVGDYKAYLDAYPDGVFAALAKVRVRRFDGQKASTRIARVEPQTPVMPSSYQSQSASDVKKAISSISSAFSEPEERVATSASNADHRLVRKAQKAFRNNQLTSPPEDNAVKWSRHMLALDPNNVEAQDIMHKVIERYLNWTERDLARGNLAKAKEHIGEAWSLRSFAANEQKAQAVDLKLRVDRDSAAASQVVDASSVSPAAQPYGQTASFNAPSAYDSYQNASPEPTEMSYGSAARGNPARDVLRLLGR
jgi:hypothetical protein